MLTNSADHILNCGHGVRLLGHYTPASGGRQDKLACLLHGWEGSAQSNYMLSVGAHLYADGYSIFRLNLRDHGPSHHLNPELYNSTRLDEIQGAMEAVQRLFPHPQNYFVGFSLGGNFGLRLGAAAAGRDYSFQRIVAVCPVISPPHVMANLEQSRIYHQHFVRIWQASLKTKLEYYPELGYGTALLQCKSLSAMNDYFVPHHTAYHDTPGYLKAYGVTGNILDSLTIPTHILSSQDDPIVLTEHLALAARPPALTIEITRYGGHCGFLQDYRLNSWADARIGAILAQ